MFITPHIIKESQTEITKANNLGANALLQREQQLSETAVGRKETISATLNYFGK